MSGWPVNCRECGAEVYGGQQFKHREYHLLLGDDVEPPGLGYGIGFKLGYQRPPMALPPPPARRNKRQEIRALDAARALANDSPSEDPECDRCPAAWVMTRNKDGDLRCPMCGHVRYKIPPDVAEEVAQKIRRRK